MATQEREELLDLVRHLPEEDVHELLALARRVEPPRSRPADQAGRASCTKAPDFAKRAKDVLRSEPGGR